ncbi:MAG: hypothetical protein COA45_03000 [Zetaproteobacteria bacterium]|nr:MAG: hypothetical protein COA45_03000 [Zetaproteobacteria bacterium]
MTQIKRVQGIFSWVVVLSEVSHVFCCVLPSLFSILTVFVGMGVIGVMPLWIDGMHHVMHDWELPLIGMSAFILALGWILHFVSKRMDCRDTGCGHAPCEKQKDKTARTLKIATFLFVINMVIYTSMHYAL